MRCCEEPCVNESGFTCPLDMRCKRSSPTAAAAFRPCWTSPASSNFRSLVECPQTPAKQSACNSRRTESWLADRGSPLPSGVDLLLDAGELLHVMADLVRQNIRFRKFAGSSETLPQFIEEAQIDVHLLVFRTVERAGGGLCHPTRGINAVSKKHELCMLVRNPLTAQDLGPGLLCVVEHERNNLHERFFALISRRIRLTCLHRTSDSAATHQRKKVTFEDQAQDQQDQKTANPKVHTAEATASTFVSAVFKVIATPTWCPTHDSSFAEVD